MKPLKHNKYRNTGLIFDLLIRKMSGDVFSDVKEYKNFKILKKFFGNGTEIGKELTMYKMLSEQIEDNNELRVNYIIESVVKVKEGINEQKLLKEKYNLISELKDLYGEDINTFFNQKIKDYKLHASIYKILEHDINDNPEDYLNSRFFIIEHLTGKLVKTDLRVKVSDNIKQIVKEFKKQDKDIQTLAFKMMLEDFDKESKKILTKQQIDFLQAYTFRDNTNNDFKKVYHKSINSAIKKLKEAYPVVDDDVTKIKLKEMFEILKNIKKKKIVNESHVITVMKFIKLTHNVDNLIKATETNNQLIGKKVK